ncbi:hypothetical protein B9Z19DRAFT_1131339 [Tuber borchii]|uniref:Uncharacterized protein n=1 Tax=Tuber borchii TaxID=42251 RepID=A0A2T6ZIW3_TUBBO|nr:hypothetical protein B9Z19DRAFT_1131339 [Tuber borchii]
MYIKPETELDGKEHLETVHLRDNSSDAYQNLGDAEETELYTEPDTETLDIEEGAEGAILGKAMALMHRYTLFDNPLLNAIALTSQVYTVWSKAQDEISNTGYIDPWEESLKLLCDKHMAVRGQFLFYIRTNIEGLYKGDRFMCSPNRYENLTFRFLAPQIADVIYGKYFDRVKMQGMLDRGFLK